jgi:hypothetical protein
MVGGLRPGSAVDATRPGFHGAAHRSSPAVGPGRSGPLRPLLCHARVRWPETRQTRPARFGQEVHFASFGGDAVAKEDRRARFGLRRGVRFAESLGDTRGSGSGDEEEWISALQAAFAGRSVLPPEDRGSAGGDAAGRPATRAAPSVPEPSDAGDAWAILSGTLVSLAEVLGGLDRCVDNLEEALIAARSASEDSRMVIDQVQVALARAVVAGLADRRLSDPTPAAVSEIVALGVRLSRLEDAVAPSPPDDPVATEAPSGGGDEPGPHR